MQTGLRKRRRRSARWRGVYEPSGAGSAGASTLSWDNWVRMESTTNEARPMDYWPPLPFSVWKDSASSNPETVTVLCEVLQRNASIGPWLREGRKWWPLTPPLIRPSAGEYFLSHLQIWWAVTRSDILLLILGSHFSLFPGWINCILESLPHISAQGGSVSSKLHGNTSRY